MLPLRVVDSRHCRHDLKGIGKLKPKHLSDGWTASETLSPTFCPTTQIAGWIWQFVQLLENRQSGWLLTVIGQFVEVTEYTGFEHFS